jgi:hypothetical protein
MKSIICVIIAMLSVITFPCCGMTGSLVSRVGNTATRRLHSYYSTWSPTRTYTSQPSPLTKTERKEVKYLKEMIPIYEKILARQEEAERNKLAAWMYTQHEKQQALSRLGYHSEKLATANKSNLLETWFLPMRWWAQKTREFRTKQVEQNKSIWQKWNKRSDAEYHNLQSQRSHLKSITERLQDANKELKNLQEKAGK